MDIISTSMGLLIFLVLCGDGWRLRYQKIRNANNNGSSVGTTGIHCTERDLKPGHLTHFRVNRKQHHRA
jgi:hypothetical protein